MAKLEFKVQPPIKLSTSLAHTHKEVRCSEEAFAPVLSTQSRLKEWNIKSPRRTFPRTPFSFRLLTPISPPVTQDTESGDISNNSSLTMDSATPNSTPELEQGTPLMETDSLDASVDIEHLLSPPRPVLWSNKSGPSAASAKLNAETIVIPSITRISPPPTAPIADDDFAPTPPITPRLVEEDDEEDCDEVRNLRRAITATVALMRSPTSLQLKGILKPAEPIPSTPPTSQTSLTSQTGNTSQASIEDPHSSGSPSTETTEDQFPVKKSVRWCLSEEQEYKESQKPQLPASPKIHRGNRLILPDDDDDELMSVRSDDMLPTPPLSPSGDADFVSVGRPVVRNLFLRSSFPMPCPTPPVVQATPTIESPAAPMSASLPIAPISKPPTRSLPMLAAPPQMGLARSASTSTFLQRSTSQSFGSTKNVRTNTRANALLGTTDGLESPALHQSRALSSLTSLPTRTQSDASGTLEKRNTKKRSRSPLPLLELDQDAADASVPPTKVPKQS